MYLRKRTAQWRLDYAEYVSLEIQTSQSGHQLYSGVPLPTVHVFNLRLFQARAAPVTPAKPVEMRPLAAAGNILPRNANGIRTHLTCELCGYEPTAKNK